jgi:hypothetical protein
VQDFFAVYRVTPHEVSKASQERSHKDRSSDGKRNAECDKSDRHTTNSKDRKDDRKRKDKEDATTSRKESHTSRSRDRDDEIVEKESASCIAEKLADYKKRRVDEKLTQSKNDDQPKSTATSVNAVKRTTDNSLDDARARYLARKTSMKVQVVADDSD